MKPTEHAIWLIESRLREKLQLDDVAEATGLSRFYISRLFAEELGMPLSVYIRRRRLSEAAKELIGGTPDILSVALGAGYGSHEAFTRAFRDEFGVTPEALRQFGMRTPIRLMEPLRMTAKPTVAIEPAMIETLPAADYVGLSRTYSMDQLGGIPDQWATFQSYLSAVDLNRLPGAYGIVRNAAKNGESVEYVCTIPAGLGLEPDGDLVAVKLPEMKLAKFAHKGHISGIKESTRAVFEKALPDAGLKPVGPVDLIEFYGPAFDPRGGFGTVGLWIHVG
jgi:AraC family transcriptional regulator